MGALARSFFAFISEHEANYHKHHERNVDRLKAVENQIHHEYPEEGRRDELVFPNQLEEHESYYCHECSKADHSTFDKLLYVPTFGNVVILQVLVFAFEKTLVTFQLCHISIRRTRSSKPGTERVGSKPLKADDHPGKVSLRGSFPIGERVLEFDREKPGKQQKHRNKSKNYFAVFFPNTNRVKHYETSQGSGKSDYRASRIREKQHSQKDDPPKGKEIVVLFLFSGVIRENPQVENNEISSRIRSVEDPLEPSNVFPINSVVNRYASTKHPVRKVR